MAVLKKCPNCSEIVPDNDARCKCGYIFTNQFSGQMTDNINRVTIANIDMPFWSIVMLMVKWAIASIPALFILWLLGVFLVWLFGMILHYV